MTRTVWIAAAALLAGAAIFAPAAQACISCSYTPEVVGTPTKSSPPKQRPKAASKERSHAPAKKQRAVRDEPRSEPKRQASERPSKHIAKRERVITERSRPSRGDQKVPVLETGKPVITEQETETAKPVETEQETGTDASVETAPDETSKATAATAAAPSNDADKRADPETKPDTASNSGDKTDCKKYFPEARITVSVPCE